MGSKLSKNIKINVYATESPSMDNPDSTAPLNSIHKGSILGITCSSSSSTDQIVTCSDDKTIAIFRYGHDVLPISTHGCILESACNNDNASKSKSIQNIKYFEGHSKTVNKVLFLGNDTLCTASRDLSLKQVSSNINHLVHIFNLIYIFFYCTRFCIVLVYYILTVES